MAEKSFSRRHFMTYAGLGALATSGNPLLSGCNNRTASRRSAVPASESDLFFGPVKPSVRDGLILPSGYRFDVAWRLTSDNRIVCYMGDDAQEACFRR